MSITYVSGDLFDFVEPKIVIPHVCNNANKWGRGFVVPLMEKYMSARLEFDKWAKQGWTRHDFATTHTRRHYGLGNTQFVTVDKEVVVANMIAQVFYVDVNDNIRLHRPLFYNKLADCMEQVASHAGWYKFKILAPKFGSELAGGNWEFVECLIQDIWYDLDVTIVEYQK